MFSVRYGIEYALDLSAQIKVVPRRDAVLRAKEYPNRIEWLGAKRIRVIFPDGVRGTISVPTFCEHICKNGNEARLRGRSTRVVIPLPLVRRGGMALAGKMKIRPARTVKMSEPNALDRVIDRMLTGDLSYEAAWIPKLKIKSAEEIRKSIPEECRDRVKVAELENGDGRQFHYYPTVDKTRTTRSKDSVGGENPVAAAGRRYRRVAAGRS